MVNLTLEQAQLFRILSSFFGPDQVILNATVKLVCGGRYPEKLIAENPLIIDWAGRYKCLFTILDQESEAKLVVEFGEQNGAVVDASRIEYRHHLESILNDCGVKYVSLSNEEFYALIDPDSQTDFVSMMHSKITNQCINTTDSSSI